jgi:hypothetical protein
MNSLFATAIRAFDWFCLRAAGLLVQGNQRINWLREWDAEVWHIRHSCVTAESLAWKTRLRSTQFCLGAFQDALCLRRIRRPGQAPLASMRGTALKCIAGLAGALAISFVFASALPGVRIESSPSRYQLRANLVLMQNALYTDNSIATITGREFRNLSASRQRAFDGLAFYRIGIETLSSPTHSEGRWQVAHASPNLFWLIAGPVRFVRTGAAVADSLPRVLISEALWTREFAANPALIGKVVRVGLRKALLSGVVPRGTWRLPGKADAWILEPDAEIPATAVGYAVAHLTPLGRSEMFDDRVHVDSYNPDDPEDDLWGVTFEERSRGPLRVYEFAVLLAFLVLPAVVSVSMGEYVFSAHRPSWTSRLRRLIFLWTKLLILLPAAYFLSLDLAYWHSTSYSSASEYFQFGSSFLICLFGMRWILLDQRRRCPVCLKRVTHPAQVGLASRTFLAWNGTEMMCTGGHTLLHVPALPTSWFSTQRWLYLDASWEFLFVGSEAS